MNEFYILMLYYVLRQLQTQSELASFPASSKESLQQVHLL